MEIALNLKTVMCSRATHYLLLHTHVNIIHNHPEITSLSHFKENFSLVRQSVNQQIYSHADRDLEANEERGSERERGRAAPLLLISLICTFCLFRLSLNCF